MGRGKVEIQNQDSHFSTAQISLRRKEKNCRLHKTLDAPSPAPFRPPSRRLPTIAGLTSTPFDPRSAPSPIPSGCPSGYCQCPHRLRNCVPGCLLHESLPELTSHSSLDGTHNCRVENPPQKSARLQSSPPPPAPPDPLPSVSPMAAASLRPSVGIAASPVAVDIGPTSLVAAHLHPRPPTGRHSCRSGHTTRGIAVFCSAWHTSIAGSGVVVLYRWGFWPFPTCPRTYPHIQARSKQGPFPPARFAARLLRYYGPLGLPPRSARFQPSGLIRSVFARPDCQVGVSPVPRCSFPTCRRLPPRKGPAFAPVCNAVCCLRREMTGSALSNTFRLII